MREVRNLPNPNPWFLRTPSFEASATTFASPAVPRLRHQQSYRTRIMSSDEDGSESNASYQSDAIGGQLQNELSAKNRQSSREFDSPRSSGAERIHPEPEDDDSDSAYYDTDDSGDDNYTTESRPLNRSTQAEDQHPQSRTSTKKPRHVKGRRRGSAVRNWSNAYLRLLNRDICATKLRQIYKPTFMPQHGSYILGSWWTPLEKEIFFNMLALKGKDGVEEIAKAIKTKTVVEVSAYLQLLDTANRNAGSSLYVKNRGRDLVSMKDIPAAVELGDNVCEELEGHADTVEAEHTRRFARKQLVRWGEFWEIDPDVAAHISDLVHEGEIESLQDIAPEGELLNVEAMLDFSRLFFMNGPEDANWRAHSDTPPTILYESVVDFHSLVRSVTRRLVAAIIFRTEQRLHTDRTPAHTPSRTVKVPDVRRTVKALKMPLNSLSFFTHLPRRNGLKVVKLKIEMNYRTPNCMSYHDVEASLSAIDKKHIKRFFYRDFRALAAAQQEADHLAALAVNPPRSPSPPPRAELEDPAHYDSESELEDLSTSYPSIPKTFARRRIRAMHRAAQQEDSYLSALDAQHTHATTHHISTQILSHPRAPPTAPPPLPRFPASFTANRHQPPTWRDHTPHVPLWHLDAAAATVKRERLRKQWQDVLARESPASRKRRLEEEAASDSEHGRKRLREPTPEPAPPRKPRGPGEKKEKWKSAAQRKREMVRELARRKDEEERGRAGVRRLGRERARLGRERQIAREGEEEEEEEESGAGGRLVLRRRSGGMGQREGFVSVVDALRELEGSDAEGLGVEMQAMGDDSEEEDYEMEGVEEDSAEEEEDDTQE